MKYEVFVFLWEIFYFTGAVAKWSISAFLIGNDKINTPVDCSVSIISMIRPFNQNAGECCSVIFFVNNLITLNEGQTKYCPSDNYIM